MESDKFLLLILRVIHRCLQSYELVYRQTYLHSNAMATLLEIGAQRWAFVTTFIEASHNAELLNVL